MNLDHKFICQGFKNLIHSFYAKNYPSEGVIPEFPINSGEDIFESQFD